MAAKEDSFHLTWLLRRWCQRSLVPAESFPKRVLRAPLKTEAFSISASLFPSFGMFFPPLAYGPFLFKHGVWCNAPSSLSGGYQGLEPCWCSPRQGLQSQTGERRTYPEPRRGTAWIRREGWRQGWREPRVPVPQRGAMERDEGTGVGMGRDGTGSPRPCCRQRSQVGTIKCRVKRFSRLIVVSFLLIAPPQVAGYSAPAALRRPSLRSALGDFTGSLLWLSARTSSPAVH